MVEVALERRLAASREDTCRVDGLNVTSLAGSGSATHRSRGHRLSVVGDGEQPVAVKILMCGLASDLGHDRAVTLQLTRLVRQSEKGLCRDYEIGPSGTVRLAHVNTLALEQVESDIGPDLIEGARLISGLQSPSEFFDMGTGSRDVDRIAVVNQKRAGQIGVGVGGHTPIGQSFLECRGAAIGICSKDQPGETTA
jgi:hypothetical protein